MLPVPLTLLKQLLKEKAQGPEIIYGFVSLPPRHSLINSYFHVAQREACDFNV